MNHKLGILQWILVIVASLVIAATAVSLLGGGHLLVAAWQALGVALSVGVVIILLLGAVTFYFLPTMIACMRKHPNALPIFVVNLFLGWTLLGWVVTLAWSLFRLPAPAEPTRG